MKTDSPDSLDPKISLTFSKRLPVPDQALAALHLALMMPVDTRMEYLHDFGLDKPVGFVQPEDFEEVASTALASHIIVFTGAGAECCAYLVESADGLYQCIIGNGQTVRESIQAFRGADSAARAAGSQFVGAGLMSLMCNVDGVFCGLTVDGFKIYAPHERDDSTLEYLDIAGLSFLEQLALEELDAEIAAISGLEVVEV